MPSKNFDAFMAESGRQAELDRMRAIPGEYERQKAKNNAPKQTDDKIGTPPSADR